MLYKFLLPRYIRQRTLEPVVRQYNRSLFKENDEVLWLFQGVCTIDTSGLVILAALSNKLEKLEVSQTIRYDTKSKDVISQMERMDFFQVCGFPFESKKTRYRKSTLCEVSSISSEEQVNMPIYKLRKMIKSQSCPSALEVAVTEVVMNAMHHAEAETPCYVVARVGNGNIDIAICDTGMGMLVHLSKTYGVLNTDVAAIGLALERYITGNRNGNRSNSGMGLYISNSIFNANKGSFAIWSGKGQYVLHKGSEKWDNNMPFWQGTIVTMRYVLNNLVDISQIYRKSSESDDNSQLESIFR